MVVRSMIFGRLGVWNAFFIYIISQKYFKKIRILILIVTCSKCLTTLPNFELYTLFYVSLLFLEIHPINILSNFTDNFTGMSIMSLNTRVKIINSMFIQRGLVK